MTEMTPLQYRMLELVLEIDAICKKHGIVYYLAGGSVLGAVRHKGFIPWDDDIDIMMTRREFNRFQEVCKTEMRDDREIITMMNTPCHTKVTIKYMNKTTCQFFRSQVLDTTGCGISLDIMILDPLPKDEKEKEQHIAEYIVYNELLTPFFMVNEYLYKHVPMYNEYHDRIEKEGREPVMKELYTRLFEDEPEESDLYLYRWGQQLLIYEHRLFGEPRYMDFEGYSLPVPERTIDFLRATYGDSWIYLPPVQQRETHTSNMNPNVAYINWLKDIKPFLNREKVLSDFVARKKHNVMKAVPAHDMAVYHYRQAALLIQLEFETYQTSDLAAMDDEALLELTGKYLSLQLSGGFVKNQIFIDIPDEKLDLVLHALLRTGEFAKAGKLIRVRKTVSRALPEYLQHTVTLQEQIAEVVRCFEDHYIAGHGLQTVEEISPKLLELSRSNPAYLNIMRCVLQLYLNIMPAAETVEDALQRTLKTFPADPEIAFWAGCLYDKLGNRDAAAEQYQKAAATTNGVILQRLKEMEGTKND